MSRLLEFILGSILISVFTVAFLFFSAVHHLLRGVNFTDCTWQGYARAWIDSNADGQMDPGEPPLSDVRVHVDHIQDQRTEPNWTAITGRDGEVQFSLSIPGCSNTFIEVYVDIPEGYRVTTRRRLEVNPDIWKNLSTKPVYYFGFRSEP